MPLHDGPNVTLIAALTPVEWGGVRGQCSANGVVDGVVLAFYLDQVLGPALRPGDVVVLDNLPVHKVDRLEQVIKKYRVRLLCLPSYSPNFNPIELTFSKLKTWLRMAQARTNDALEEVFRPAAK